MDFSGLPLDYFITSKQFTKKVHTELYPSIDPTTPALSQEGKVVILTGASRGIGRHGLVASFAKAHPKALVLVARNPTQLDEVAQDVRAIDSSIEVLTVPADITDEGTVDALFNKVKSTFGTADVLVNNAGIYGVEGILGEVDIKKWWNTQEVNVKGAVLMTHGFLALVGREKRATIVTITSQAAVSVFPAGSAYCMSKLAVTHLQQFVAAEYPSVTAVSVHPGILKTDMMTPEWAPFANDPPELVGGTAVWFTTDAARFLSGRFLDTHWSVDELVARKDEIVGEGKLVTGLNVKLGKEYIK